MQQTRSMRAVVSGGMAGVVNGFFGGGGGMVLVPLLAKWIKIGERKAFATSTAIILPLCTLSSAIYLWRGELQFSVALPYLLGGTLGGIFGGMLFKKVNILWLQRGFALLILYAGVKAAFFA